MKKECLPILYRILTSKLIVLKMCSEEILSETFIECFSAKYTV